LPDFGIFGLLDGKFHAKTQRSQICVIVPRNLFCRNWDLPDLWIFGLLIKIFARRRNGRKFDVIVHYEILFVGIGICQIYGIFGLLDEKFRAKTQWTQFDVVQTVGIGICYMDLLANEIGIGNYVIQILC
jgi:hypothetical protein